MTRGQRDGDAGRDDRTHTWLEHQALARDQVETRIAGTGSPRENGIRTEPLHRKRRHAFETLSEAFPATR